MSDRRTTGVVPYTFSIVGVQKAGTSTLMAMIHRHQQVARSPRKELHYFDNEARDWSDPDTSDYVCPRTRKRQRIAGDSTPLYIFWPHALQRMHDHRPETRLIAIFRDPIERVFSQWSMNRGRRPQLTPDWPTYIQTQRHKTLPDSLPTDIHVSRYPALSGVVRGFYGQQLERGLGIFPREQWLLLSFREMLADHKATLNRVTEHNDANVISVGGRMHTVEDMTRFVEVFLGTAYSDEERHNRRIGMLSDYEKTGNLPPLPESALGHGPAQD